MVRSIVSVSLASQKRILPSLCGVSLTEDHRLEGGGFDSRLKARLSLEPEKTVNLDSLDPSMSSDSVSLRCQPSPVQRTGSGRLEGEGF